ncbi:MAG TPA: hypothetical protein DD979_00135 [Gammaproteobacteria bacterium]|jgi:hypothetical protein|nr:hypothetical protein [Gammaproteobacteria bacterium]
MPVFEILTWRALPSVADDDMVDAMAGFSEAVKTLPGFIHQSLYKNAQGQWVCIYFWQTEAEAHASNTAVAGLKVFENLMRLIEAGSVTMEVLSALQSSDSEEALADRSTPTVPGS